MKKLLFAAVDMNVGGIETALLTLLNYLADKEYKITLVLEKKEGPFLRDLDKKINIVEYKPNDSKNVIVRKISNLMKRIGFILKYKNRFDFAASFATYSNMASFVARTASTNNALWGHADYLELFKNDINKVKEFFENLHYDKFKKIIFVSQKGCETFTEIYPEMKDKVIHCNNIVNYEKIENLSNETIEETKKTYTFVNVGRHDETQKKLTRIIEAAKMLKEDNIDFEILFIGEGKDTEFYKKLAEAYKVQEYVRFLGVKKNPYPYMKLADSVVLSSDYEGYPVVFLESLILNKPIITTDVSDAMEDIENRYGKVVDKNAIELYKTMKEFATNGYEPKCKFNAREYKKESIRKLEKIFNK